MKGSCDVSFSKSSLARIVACSFFLCASCFSVSAEEGVFPSGWGKSKADEALLRAQAEKQKKDAADALRGKQTDTKTDTRTDTKGGNQGGGGGSMAGEGGSMAGGGGSM